ncbi:MAG: hypothetical protein R3F13_10410 [Prosthecobacter sp.]
MPPTWRSDPAVITAAMKKAVTYAHTHLAREGGYATSWDKEGKIGEVEHGKSPTIISIQPHGTTTMGLVMLKAWQATATRSFSAAKDAAKSLSNASSRPRLAQRFRFRC